VTLAIGNITKTRTESDDPVVSVYGFIDKQQGCHGYQGRNVSAEIKVVEAPHDCGGEDMLTEANVTLTQHILLLMLLLLNITGLCGFGGAVGKFIAETDMAGLMAIPDERVAQILHICNFTQSMKFRWLKTRLAFQEAEGDGGAARKKCEADLNKFFGLLGNAIGSRTGEEIMARGKPVNAAQIEAFHEACVLGGVSLKRPDLLALQAALIAEAPDRYYTLADHQAGTQDGRTAAAGAVKAVSEAGL
jgi:hypothetical protein